jgi:hypothetical protein
MRIIKAGDSNVSLQIEMGDADIESSAITVIRHKTHGKRAKCAPPKGITMSFRNRSTRVTKQPISYHTRVSSGRPFLIPDFQFWDERLQAENCCLGIVI